MGEGEEGVWGNSIIRVYVAVSSNAQHSQAREVWGHTPPRKFTTLRLVLGLHTLIAAYSPLIFLDKENDENVKMGVHIHIQITWFV